MHPHGNGLHKAHFRLCLQWVKMPNADLQVLAHQLQMVKIKAFERFERKNQVSTACTGMDLGIQHTRMKRRKDHGNQHIRASANVRGID
jgi:hypothetical protein